MENISYLMTWLPEGYEQDCYKEKAIVRKRGVTSPADLMMLVMFHLQNGCSLLEISEVARITKLGNMSDVAFMKRFEKCVGWFKGINEKLGAECWVNYEKPPWLEGKTLVGVDGSDVSEKGRSGRIYRLHYALDIFKMVSVEHKITTNKTGESLLNFNPQPGYIMVADRCYATIKGMAHCSEHGAEYIIRLRKNSFTVRNGGGEKVDLVEMLAKLSEGEYLDYSAFATNADGEKMPVRVCATRKTAEAIAQTWKKMHRQESRKQIKISDEAKTFNEYIIVVTNLGEAVSAEEILGAYRLRWQVEIYFKRLKSILDFGELPKRRPDSVIAWLNGKLMIALLIEIAIAKAAFSPEGQN